MTRHSPEPVEAARPATAVGTAEDLRHGHGHGHGHGVSADADRRLLSGALALIVGFMAAEVVVGFAAGSLALITDAAHMLTDAIAIALALIAIRLAARPPAGGFTFGFKRVEILSAQANGITLLLLAAFFVYESVERLIHPPEVEGGLVLVTGVVGIFVNLAATWLISRANRTSLNVEGAYQHILNDLFAFIATAAAGLVVLLTGFTRADPIAALIVAALMLKAGLGLVRDSGRIFLEAAPAGLDPAALGKELCCIPGVVEVHDLHVWQITSGEPAASAHVLVREGLDCHLIRGQIETLLAERHHLTHSTLQVDHASGEAPELHCSDSHGAVHRGHTRRASS
ncbi:cation diffusion facilitator family transporter [Kribbella flavida DSM 17836]|uniref:Cation diffusion facilitator family transporter n=1 Tax=Kribbella flavida (strain DSM 17836 / JCM 10339 / NBRC 14399) TaxID=479435 RepID=D2PPM5_KRIFD|nr:cation diffusion facilitator family transporter [Kribbella flavida]ADB30987.1 cation diffusion facilitator family transporter [Kribbella flavida DSM 17836]